MLSLPVLTGTDLDAITLPTKTITAITSMGNRVITAHTDMPGIIMDRMPPAGIATGLTDMAGIIMADNSRKKVANASMRVEMSPFVSMMFLPK